MGVGNNKRVDRKNKASSDCSIKVFWDSSGREKKNGTKLSFQSTDGNQGKQNKQNLLCGRYRTQL